jgi:hypothetical protein
VWRRNGAFSLRWREGGCLPLLSASTRSTCNSRRKCYQPSHKAPPRRPYRPRRLPASPFCFIIRLSTRCRSSHLKRRLKASKASRVFLRRQRWSGSRLHADGVTQRYQILSFRSFRCFAPFPLSFDRSLAVWSMYRCKDFRRVSLRTFLQVYPVAEKSRY